MKKTTKILFSAAALSGSGLLLSSLLPAQTVFFPPADFPAVGSLGGPDRTLTPAEQDQWLRGRALFDRDFHVADGLGTPELNADSCRGCHQDPVMGGAGGLELNVSRAAYDNDGTEPYQDVPGGQAFSKLRPPTVFGREEYDFQNTDIFEQRQTPSLLGLGLVDTIPDIEIMMNEDPNDLDGDFVRGRARIVMVGGLPEVGRFGWKAQIPRLADFVDDAMAGELGVTTPDNGRGFALLTDADLVADPELSPAQHDDVAFFITHLAPPQRRVGPGLDPKIDAGEALFTSVGCAKCHIPTLQGTGGPVPLYSDLLIHDVMPANFRGMAEPGAGMGEFRTPPLWGIRQTAPYMHDGRAEDFDAAIRAHEGEAFLVTLNYLSLTDEERSQLIAFLYDL